MKLSKLPKITLLLLLALLVMVKPTLRIAIHAAETPHKNIQAHDLQSFSGSRSKYDARTVSEVVKAHYTNARANADVCNPGYSRAQPAVYVALTARHLLNIHFRILPERKIFLQQGRLTV